MLKKIFGLSLALILIVTTCGGSVWAYYHDDQSASSNSIEAGTLDLQMNTDNSLLYYESVTILSAANIKPGNYVPRPTSDSAADSAATVYLFNNGSVTAGSYSANTDATLTINANYAAVGTFSGSPTLDNYAAALEIKKFTLNGSSMLGLVPNSNPATNSWKDLQDLKAATINTYLLMYTGQPVTIQIQLLLRADVATVDYQNKGLDLTLSFILRQ
jgi:predicted ribosomally synthesized peptide with SipW-like signal peptide